MRSKTCRCGAEIMFFQTRAGGWLAVDALSVRAGDQMLMDHHTSHNKVCTQPFPKTAEEKEAERAEAAVKRVDIEDDFWEKANKFDIWIRKNEAALRKQVDDFKKANAAARYLKGIDIVSRIYEQVYGCDLT